MTALARYQLLEAQGRYFDGETAASREVIVKFGDATLVLMDQAGVPIAHWALAGMRALDDGHDGSGGGVAILTLIPDYDGEERLIIDDGLMIGAIRAVCPELGKKRPVNRRRWRRIAFWTGAATASIYAIVFHLVPALSDQLATLIPPEAEVAMGETMVGQFAALLSEGEPRFCSTELGDAALTEMTARLSGSAGAHVPLKVQVLDHEMVNAFALPGGQIVLFRGLLDSSDTPEEVAGVLAHEIGHVVARDPTRLTLRSAGTAGILGLILGDFTGAGATVVLSEALLRTGYQREAEAQADAFAARVLSKEGLPTAPFAGFFDKLREQVGDTPDLLSHLSTHPDLAGRAEATRAADTIGQNPFDPALDDQAWVALKNICD